MKKLISFSLLIAVVSFSALNAQQPDPPGQVKDQTLARNQAYLFAHMTHKDYGHLYYSVSTDGLHWKNLNDGKRVFEGYRGHPDICKGHDGRYYLVGNNGDSSPDINFWVSEDLITWEKYNTYTPDLKSTPDYSYAMQRIGAPKMFYDESTSQYILTWHTPHKISKEDPELYWASQRTIICSLKRSQNFFRPSGKVVRLGYGNN